VELCRAVCQASWNVSQLQNEVLPFELARATIDALLLHGGTLVQKATPAPTASGSQEDGQETLPPSLAARIVAQAVGGVHQQYIANEVDSMAVQQPGEGTAKLHALKELLDPGTILGALRLNYLTAYASDTSVSPDDFYEAVVSFALQHSGRWIAPLLHRTAGASPGVWSTTPTSTPQSLPKECLRAVRMRRKSLEALVNVEALLLHEMWFQFFAAAPMFESLWCAAAKDNADAQALADTGLSAIGHTRQEEEPCKIRVELISGHDWQHTVECLTMLCQAPNGYVPSMVSAMNLLPRALHKDIEELQCSKTVAFGGDDLIPVLLFAVSRVRDGFRLVTLVAFLLQACSATHLQGELGYYLSSLHTCLGYAQSCGQTVTEKEERDSDGVT